MTKAVSMLKAGGGALILALTAACTTTGPVATGSTTGARTVAFEQIDGPPLAVFKGLVAELDGQAKAHGIDVVAPGGEAAYRIRGYLANHVVGGRPHVAYVWDIYDSEERRNIRITGEEAGAKAARRADAWEAADPAMVKRIAETSVGQLASFLGTPARSTPVARPAPATPASAPASRPDVAPPAEPAVKPEPTDPTESDTPIAAAPATQPRGLFAALFASPMTAEPSAAEPDAPAPIPANVPLPRRKPDRTAAIDGVFSVAGR